jgi:hypothetical protein
MPDTREMKERLDEMGAALAASPTTSADMLRFLYLWKALEAAEAQERPLPDEPRGVSRPTSVPRPRVRHVSAAEANRDKIVGAVCDVLRVLNPEHPLKTSEIFLLLPPEIVSSIPGKEPRYNLSAIMHNSKRFKSYGREGWMLPREEAASEVTSGEIGQEALGIH